MSNITKQCRSCKQEKPLSEFYEKRGYGDGHENWCKDCRKTWRSGYESENREKLLAQDSSRKLKKNYGISLEEYDRLLKKQNGVCASCGKPPNGRRLHVDHDHRTGAVRGLLCSGCNVALGAVNDNPSILEKLIRYIKRQ